MKAFLPIIGLLMFAQSAFAQVTFQSQSREVLRHFPLVVVVNKAAQGFDAQQAQIYVDGKHIATVAVSTGREKKETSKSGREYTTTTPVGWFSPTFQDKNYFSQTWQAPMPWSTFFKGGIAFHAALPAYFDKLGSRASGGCIRMMPQTAEWLFKAVQHYGKGTVPAFTRHGGLQRDANGNLVATTGWRTLIVVEDRPSYGLY